MNLENLSLRVSRQTSSLNGQNFFAVMQRRQQSRGRVTITLDFGSLGSSRRNFTTVATEMSQTQVYVALGQIGEAAKEFAQNPESIEIRSSGISEIRLFAGSIIIATARRQFSNRGESFDLDVRDDLAKELGLTRTTLF